MNEKRQLKTQPNNKPKTHQRIITHPYIMYHCHILKKCHSLRTELAKNQTLSRTEAGLADSMMSQSAEAQVFPNHSTAGSESFQVHPKKSQLAAVGKRSFCQRGRCFWRNCANSCRDHRSRRNSYEHCLPSEYAQDFLSCNLPVFTQNSNTITQRAVTDDGQMISTDTGEVA